jgi:nicotinamidase-related amidase
MNSARPAARNLLARRRKKPWRAVAALIQRDGNVAFPVLWVRSVRETGALEFTAFKQTTHLIDGTWAVEYTSPLEVLEGEPVFKKYCHDCFTHTGLAEYLTDRRMTAPDWTMIVVGVAFPSV